MIFNTPLNIIILLILYLILELLNIIVLSISINLLFFIYLGNRNYVFLYNLHFQVRLISWVLFLFFLLFFVDWNSRCLRIWFLCFLVFEKILYLKFKYTWFWRGFWRWFCWSFRLLTFRVLFWSFYIRYIEFLIFLFFFNLLLIIFLCYFRTFSFFFFSFWCISFCFTFSPSFRTFLYFILLNFNQIFLSSSFKKIFILLISFKFFINIKWRDIIFIHLLILKYLIRTVL